MEQKFKYTKNSNEKAIRETVQGVKMPRMSFIVFFASSRFDFPRVAQIVHEEYPDIPQIGCVSQGEITQEGFVEGTFCICSIYHEDFKVAPLLMHNIKKNVMLYKCHIFQALQSIDVNPHDIKCTDKFFALTLIDAFSSCEERVNTLLENTFGSEIKMVGGSGGDLNTKYSYIAVNGVVEQDACAILFVSTSKKIVLYNENIYTPKGVIHRITEADTVTRTVKRADDIPFLDLYANAIGVPSSKINSSIFARNPIGRISGDFTYIASPLQINADKSVTFYTRVLTGRQFYFMEAADILEKTKETATKLNQQFRKIDVIFGFNCILRYLQMKEEHNCSKPYTTITQQTHAPYYGFTTLGEMIRTTHANQTLILIAIGD